jgi:8-oxo-dGTP pyrophosphatase MutT (NUDIX family)
MSTSDKKQAAGDIVIRQRRRLACSNSRFDVYLDDIETVDGQTVRDYLVVEPRVRGANLVTGVGILPIHGQKTGLLRIYRHAIREFCWEIPRGFVDPGEEDVVSARRELLEETGLDCDGDELVSLGYVTPEAGILSARVHLFAARNCFSTKPFRPEEFGHREFHMLDTQRLEAMIVASEIQDPCTLVACCRYLHGMRRA